MSEREAWVAMASAQGVGDHTFTRLLEVHGSASAALAAAAALPTSGADRALAGWTGDRLRRGLARSIRDAASDPGRTQRAVEALGGWTLTPLDEAYPQRLSAIEEPPPVLYGLGDPATLSSKAVVAVVGTRRPSVLARDLATRIGHRLAEAGACVVSGLAIGIDAVVHRAALEGVGGSVAIIGSGIDAPGPMSNRRLADRLARSGAIAGELPPGARATRGTFPRRNRIISGLATATIVIEAPARSGALITARHALEQGRRLLVAPGRPLDPRVRGNLVLLRESPALPLIGLDEMLADLDLDAESPVDGAASQLRGPAALRLLEPTQQRVASALAGGPATIDALCRVTSLDASVVAAALTMLQLRGWATAHGPTQLPAGPLTRMDK